MWRVVLVGFSCACISEHHVRIAPPPPNLLPEQRIAAFQKFRKHQNLVQIQTQCLKGGCSSQEVLLLNDGTTVRELDDVLPLLPPDSTTARAAVGAARAKDRQRQWGLGFGTLALGGVIVVGVGARDENAAMTAAGFGLMAVAVGCLVPMVKSYYEARDTQRLALLHYDSDLARTFKICVSGMAVVPCEGTPPPTPATPAPTPP